MKKLFVLIFMAALTMAATAQKEPQYISSFKYDKRVHDFGTIK